MEAYEAENSAASVPLVVSRKESSGLGSDRLLEQNALVDISAFIRTAEPLPGADPGDVKRLRAWAAQDSANLRSVPGMRAINRSAGSEGDDAERRNRFIIDAMPRTFELKGASAVAYWSLASNVSLQDLRRAEDRIGSDRLIGHRERPGNLRFDVDSGRTTVDSYLQNSRDSESEKLTVSKAAVEGYNGALVAANRVAKEYDRALKADGRRGYPKSWIDAKRELGDGGAQAKAPKVIRISDYGDRLSVNSGLKDRMNRLFDVLAS